MRFRSSSRCYRSFSKVEVYKFGGSALRSERSIGKSAEFIAKKIKEGAVPIVIVSAMGKGESPYSTDNLLSLAGTNLEEEELTCLLSIGETVSSVLFSKRLRELGVASRAIPVWKTPVLARVSQTGYFVEDVDVEPLLECLEEGRVPIVPGFFGRTADRVVCLGRGSSDLVAVAIAAKFGLKRVYLIKDVAGIFEADPKVVVETKKIREVTWEECREIGASGGEVVMARATELAEKFGVEIVVGTPEEMTVVGQRIREAGQVTAVAMKGGYTVVISERDPEGVLELLQKSKISLDVINFRSGGPLVAGISPGQGGLPKLPEGCKLIKGAYKLSVVGSGIHGVPGIFFRGLEAVKRSGARVLASSDSSAVVSFLIVGDGPKAMKALYREFFGKGGGWR